MFKFFQLCTSIMLCCFILLNTAHAQVATLRGGEIIIPMPNCGQVRLIAKLNVPPNLKSLLNSLGYYSQLTGAYFFNAYAYRADYFGTSVSDVWSKMPYSTYSGWAYKGPVSSSPYRKIYAITLNGVIRVGYEYIVEEYSTPFIEMRLSFSQAVDKQAWTDNIARQLQGVSTSVDANGDGIIVTPGTCPTVNITLDKPTVSACEAETGSLTVNDPSAQGGTVTLTLPDASTQSFTYAAGSPPSLFNYAVSEPVGSTLAFSATATSNSGATSQQPATATAQVIAGGLNVTITPAKTVVEPTLPVRRKKKQNGANQTSVTITVKDSASQPIDGANIALAVERASTKFGGHDHDAATIAASTRPLGTTTTPIGKGQGVYTSTYTASAFAAEDKIRANVSFQGCSANVVSSPITARVFGLSLLQVPPPHVAIGGTSKHTGPNDKGITPASPDNNHWVTLKTNNTMSYLITLYSLNYGAGLYINDASLPFGGRFDVNGNWAGSHDLHRRGIDLDIRLYDTANTSINETVEKNINFLLYKQKWLKELVFGEVHGSDSNRHWHIYFW